MITIKVVGSYYHYDSDKELPLRNKETGEVRETWLVGLDKPLDLEEVTKNDTKNNK